MSLLQRMERAQQAKAAAEAAEAAAASGHGAPGLPAAATPTGIDPAPDASSAPPSSEQILETSVVDASNGTNGTNGHSGIAVPVGPGPSAGLGPTRTPVREELIREVRLHLQTEVVGAFKALLDAKDDDVQRTIEGLVDRVIVRNGFAVTRDERVRLVEEMVHDVTGFGPLEPLLADPTITEVMVNGPDHIYIERRGKIERIDSVFLNDEHVLRIIDRIITPLGRRIDESSPRVDARLPDGSRVNAIIEPLSLVGPVITVRKFSQTPVHGRRPHPVRDGDARDVRVPPGVHRGPAQPLRVRRHRLGQDDDAQRPVVVHPERRADRHDRGRRRAPAPPGARHHARVAAAQPRGRGRDHDPRTCSATRCTCGPTGSSSASAAPARRSTCSRR